MDVEKLKEIVDRIHQGKNIHEHLDLIAGLPYEDYETFAKSFDEVYQMKPEQLQLGFLKVLKGSLMCEKAAEYGINYTSKPPYEVLYSKWLPYEDVLKLKKIEEMVELYYNSNQFTHTLPILEKNFKGAFAMYEAMADFYERKGYFVQSPARAYRYEVLLQFAVETNPALEDLYKEALTYDMYLRENLKSRPAFAKDLAPWKEDIRTFYQNEEEQRNYLKTYTQYNAKQMSKMTHLEVFHYPVWNTETLDISNLTKLEHFVLFDYASRNPLTYEAKTYIV